MDEGLPLGLLYQKQSPQFKDLSVLEREIHAFLIGEPVCIDNILAGHISPTSSNELLIIQLLVRMSGSDANRYESILSSRSQQLSQYSWNERSQYSRVLAALYHCYAGLPVPAVHPHLLESGAAPLESGGYCPWRQLPYSPLHAEFGTLLMLLALRKDDEKLRNDVVRMAYWHLNTLSHDLKPFPSLFIRDEQSSLNLQLSWNYLFFHGVSILTGHKPLQEVAKRQLSWLEQESSSTIDPSIVLFERVLENELSTKKHPQMQSEWDSLSLRSLFIDPHTALAGYRHENLNVYSTLHGSYTGMGCFLLKDMGIVNFGPHYLPLDVRTGFGIEGNALSDKGMRQTSVTTTLEGFNLKGCVRLVDKREGEGLGHFSGVWIETQQDFSKERLDIKTNFLGYEGLQLVGFSFFVKASRFEIDGTPHDSYKGNTKTISFHADVNQIVLKSNSYCQMEIAPLSPSKNHWGANILVTYYPDSSQSEFAWEIKKEDNCVRDQL